MLAVCALLDPCGHIPFFGFPLTLRADRCHRPLVGGWGVHGGSGLGEMFLESSVSFLVEVYMHVHFRN